eukprot:10436163-Karenia_brevis.AAC.1
MKEKAFMRAVDDLIDDHQFSACCWARISEMKDIFYCAYRDFKSKAEHRGALLAKEGIFLALQAIRANDTEDVD